MVRADLDAVTEIEALCFSVPWSRCAFERELDGNVCARYLVGELDGRVVAYAGVWLVIDEGHVTNIAIHPDYRRRGLGEAVTRALMRLCASNSCTWMTLEVRRSNEAAIALYTKLGFQPAGYRKGYYEDNKEDALIMVCEYEHMPEDDEG